MKSADCLSQFFCCCCCFFPNCNCRFIALSSTLLSCFGIRMLWSYWNICQSNYVRVEPFSIFFPPSVRFCFHILKCLKFMNGWWTHWFISREVLAYPMLIDCLGMLNCSTRGWSNLNLLHPRAEQFKLWIHPSRHGISVLCHWLLSKWHQKRLLSCVTSCKCVLFASQLKSN